MTNHEMVREFNTTFGVHREPTPAIPPLDTSCMRIRLIREELDELVAASNDKDVVEALDAIGDLLYVVYGAADAYGFSPELLAEAFKEIHRSNMSKLWTAGQIYHSKAIGEVIKFKPVTVATGGPVTTATLYIVTREDGKIIKPPTFTKPDLKAILDKHAASTMEAAK